MKTEKMEYSIETKGKIIACFVNKEDRDYCIDTLREIFDDCVFKEIDEDENS